MSNTMITRCPHCCVKGAHPVIKTDPTEYYWDGFSESRLKEAFGQGLSYRVHDRECFFCEKIFRTCEFSRNNLDNIIKLWRRSVMDSKIWKHNFDESEAQFSSLLSHFDAFLKRRGSGRINSLAQEVGMLGMELGYDTVQRLKSYGMKNLHHILLSQKSELVQDDCLTEAQWQKLAALFAESGLKLKDDARSGEDVSELPMTA